MTVNRLSNIDTLMLKVEGSTQPNIGTGVMVFGASVDYDRLKLTIRARLLCFDRFRQRVVEPMLPLAPLRWEDDPSFDLNYHLQPAVLPPPADQTALQRLVSLLAGMPLDLNRPLWEVHYIEHYGQGCALICRVHHSLADGVALMHVLLSLADPNPDAPLPILDPDCWPSEPRSSFSSSANGRLQGVGNLVNKSRVTVGNPPSGVELARIGKDGAAAVRELLLSAPDADTALRGSPSEAKRVAWSAPLSLEEIKEVGNRLCGTVNDVLLAALTGALRHYLQGRGDPLAGGPIRALIPISLRPSGSEQELGNKIGIVLLPLPVDIADPLERFREVKLRMDEFKDSLEAPIVYAAMNTFGRAPSGLINPFVEHIGSRATVVVTNVKGPQEPLYLAGAPLEEFMFWIPRFGGIGLGIGILSYAGTVRLGVISDRDVVDDPENVMAAFHDAFQTLRGLALDEAPATSAVAPTEHDVPAAAR